MKKRIFISNTLMVIVTLAVFLVLNLFIIKIYWHSAEAELRETAGQIIEGSGRNAGGMDDSSGQILDFIWDRRCPLHFYSRCDQPDIHRKADAAYYGAA